jgi:Tol biopolymer transport system component
MQTDFLIQRISYLLALGLGLAVSSVAAPLQLVTAVDPSASQPAGGGGDSWHPILTPDGRYVLFASRANNLVLSGTNSPFLNQVPPKINVFLRDRITGTTTLVSVNMTGTGPGNGDSIPTALSTNGQFALFESAASDLVPGDTNNATDIFLRDLVHGTNQLVSVNTNGSIGNGASWESVMTPDGRYVAFASLANRLAPNDNNQIQDIFVRYTQAGVTVLASPGAAAASASYVSSSDSPQITPDGRYVVFRSSAIKLVYPGSSVVNEIYVRDLGLNTTTLVSTNAHNVLSGTPYSYNQVISDDGQHVAFESSVSRVGIIQRYNLQTGFTDIIYTNGVGTYAYNHFRTVDMTPDGRFVTFIGNTDTSGTNSSVFVWDAQTGMAILVSTNLNGVVPANSVCDYPTIDPSGRWIAFLSTATNLTTNIVAGDFHLYVHDSLTGTTTLVDAGASGAGLAKDILSAPRLTPDGRFLAFDCSDADLVANDNNRAFDVFVTDLIAGTNDLISVRQSMLPSQTSGGATLGPVYSVSSDGRYLAFSATGVGLLAGGYTNVNRGVFVRDELNGTNVLVSVDTNGLGGADGWSFDPSISGDGLYVAFTSRADNLVAGDSNNLLDVFVRDLQSGTTTLVSMNYTGTGSGTGASYSPTISTDGRYVLFHSTAYDLFPGGSYRASPPENLFLRDLQLGTNYAITASTSASGAGVFAAAMTPDAHFVAYGRGYPTPTGFVVWDAFATKPVYTNNAVAAVSSISVSPDGNRIVYVVSSGFYGYDRAANSNWLVSASILPSHAGLQFTADSRFLVYATTMAQVAGDTNGVADVYLYDFQTRSNFLISQSCKWLGAANGISDSPTISADGRFIAYRSFASDLVFGDTNGLPDVFVFDRQTDTTTLVSASVFGDFAANNRSLAPAFSGDSQTLVFQSWAADLTAQDFNQSADLFALKLYGSIASPPFIGQIIFAPVAGQNPLLAWPATAGNTYQVQFKNKLSDPVWQNLNANVSVVGDRAFATDFTPGPGQRFYRIVAH